MKENEKIKQTVFLRTTLRKLLDERFYTKIFKKFVFLLVSNIFLLGLGILMFALANFAVLYRDIPPLTGEQSLLKLQPSLSILPKPDSLSSVIKYQWRKRYTYSSYVHDLFAYIQNYERHVERSRLLDCTHNVAYIDHPKFSCKFSLDLGNIGCNMGNQYGFDDGQPCVLIRLNRVYGWVPDIEVESVNNATQNGFPTIKIKCEGVTDTDKENIGSMCYYDEESALRRTEGFLPDQEGGCIEDYGQIRNYYYPYKKQRSYQIPFVWVKFNELKRNVIIMIQCWAIAKNIALNEEDGTGYQRFEFLVD